MLVQYVQSGRGNGNSGTVRLMWYSTSESGIFYFKCVIDEFYFGWVTGVVCYILDSMESQGLTVQCIWSFLCDIHSVSSNHSPYLEYVFGTNHALIICTNRRIQNYDTYSINCVWLQREHVYS